jgi:hypothetical protein
MVLDFLFLQVKEMVSDRMILQIYSEADDYIVLPF